MEDTPTPLLIVPDPTKTLVWSDYGIIYLLDEWRSEGMPSYIVGNPDFDVKCWEWEHPFAVNKNNNSLYLGIWMSENLNWINNNRENINIVNNLDYLPNLDSSMLDKDELYYFWDYKKDIIICGEGNFHEIVSQCNLFALLEDLDLILYNQKFAGLIMRNASFYSAFYDPLRIRENYLGKINTDGLNEIERELLSSLIEEYAKGEDYISSAFIKGFREKVASQAAHIREELMYRFQFRIEDEERSETLYKQYAQRTAFELKTRVLRSVISPTVLPAADYEI
jgi:hypothetical protein